MKNDIIKEQIEYYRARAQEYDRSISEAESVFAKARSLLLQMGQFDRILELACGTGFWTETLATMGNNITALDAAPEMLTIAKARLNSDRVHFEQADLFQWQPGEQFDLVFFANWLSHIPPKSVDEFLGKVRASIRTGGGIAIVDQHAPSSADSAIAKQDIYAVRPLEDGRQFTIVKAFHDLAEIENKLRKLGFDVSSTKFSETFFFLSGTLKT